MLSIISYQAITAIPPIRRRLVLLSLSLLTLCLRPQRSHTVHIPTFHATHTIHAQATTRTGAPIACTQARGWRYAERPRVCWFHGWRRNAKG